MLAVGDWQADRENCRDKSVHDLLSETTSPARFLYFQVFWTLLNISNFSERTDFEQLQSRNTFCPLAAFRRHRLDVIDRLRLGFAPLFACAFVFDEELAFPEQLNLAEVAGGFQDGDFKTGDELARDAEDIEEFVPEHLLVGALAGRVLVVARELDGVVADFIPRKRHGGRLKK